LTTGPSIIIEDIIETTDFNPAAIYKYFGGKSGLFLVMLNIFIALQHANLNKDE